jgi:hypothetical protein
MQKSYSLNIYASGSRTPPMKKLIISLILISFNSFAGNISSACTLDGIPLKGKVQIVNSFADFKVKIDNSFPDLKVEVVNSFPNKCGQWKFVNSFPDFTIEIVNSFEDFSIKYVNSFPGL